MTTAFIFPGQGSQSIGMMNELAESNPLIQDTFSEASAILGYDLWALVTDGPAEKLNSTEITQPAMLTAGVATWRAWKAARGGDPALMAGHSLGEYTALLTSGAVDFKTTLNLVLKRATYMTELGKGYPGAGLMAIVDKNRKLDYDKIGVLCKEFDVYITLKNTKSQIVVGGSKKQLAELSKKLKSEGKRSTTLKVEGPFHTPIMKPAADKFKKELNKSNLHIALRPIIANVSTDAIVDPSHIREELYKQIFQIVDWKGSIEKIIRNGGDLFIEVGPKRVLTNMINDIDSSIPKLNVEDIESLENTMKELTS